VKLIKNLLKLILSIMMIITCAGIFTNKTDASQIYLAYVGDTIYFSTTLTDKNLMSTAEAEGNYQIVFDKSSTAKYTCELVEDGGVYKIAITFTSPGNCYLPLERYDGSNWEDVELLKYAVGACICKDDTYTFTIPRATLAQNNEWASGVTKVFLDSNYQSYVSMTTKQVGNNIEIKVRALKDSGELKIEYIKANTNEDEWGTSQYFYIKLTPHAELNLDDDTQSEEFEQLYTIEGTDGGYTDVVKVKVEWDITDIAVTYTENRVWDPENLKWDVKKNNATITGGKAEFTLTNYSSVKVKGTASFAVETALKDTIDADKIVYTNNKKTIDSVVNADKSIDADKKSNLPSNKITVDLNDSDASALITDELLELEDTTEATKFGTYTLKIEQVKPKVIAVSASDPNLIMSISSITVEEDTWAQAVVGSLKDVTFTVSYQGNVIMTCSFGLNDSFEVIVINSDTETAGELKISDTNIASTAAVTTSAIVIDFWN